MASGPLIPLLPGLRPAGRDELGEASAALPRGSELGVLAVVPLRLEAVVQNRGLPAVQQVHEAGTRMVFVSSTSTCSANRSAGRVTFRRGQLHRLGADDLVSFTKVCPADRPPLRNFAMGAGASIKAATSWAAEGRRWWQSSCCRHLFGVVMRDRTVTVRDRTHVLPIAHSLHAGVPVLQFLHRAGPVPSRVEVFPQGNSTARSHAMAAQFWQRIERRPTTFQHISAFFPFGVEDAGHLTSTFPGGPPRDRVDPSGVLSGLRHAGAVFQSGAEGDAPGVSSLPFIVPSADGRCWERSGATWRFPATPRALAAVSGHANRRHPCQVTQSTVVVPTVSHLASHAVDKGHVPRLPLRLACCFGIR